MLILLWSVVAFNRVVSWRLGAGPEQAVAMEICDWSIPISSLNESFRYWVTEMFARRRGRPGLAATSSRHFLSVNQKTHESDQNARRQIFRHWNPKIDTVTFDLCSKILMCLLSIATTSSFSSCFCCIDAHLQSGRLDPGPPNRTRTPIEPASHSCLTVWCSAF